MQIPAEFIKKLLNPISIEGIIEACAPFSAVADITLQCGFTSQSHFTNIFRQIAKTTPKIYQRDFG
jgi:AraC-like DNA-binding protein